MESLRKHGGVRRKCLDEDCKKGAQGITPYCKAHGGGKRCQEPKCKKSAQGSTLFCVAHGGGRRCKHSGKDGHCAKSAQGNTQFCVAHGGGIRCEVDSCSKSAVGSAQKCIAHGGGKRCQHEGCAKSAQGSTNLCVSHGGGRRCQAGQCSKSAAGSTKYCKLHGVELSLSTQSFGRQIQDTIQTAEPVTVVASTSISRSVPSELTVSASPSAKIGFLALSGPISTKDSAAFASLRSQPLQTSLLIPPAKATKDLVCLIDAALPELSRSETSLTLARRDSPPTAQQDELQQPQVISPLDLNTVPLNLLPVAGLCDEVEDNPSDSVGHACNLTLFASRSAFQNASLAPIRTEPQNCIITGLFLGNNTVSSIPSVTMPVTECNSLESDQRSSGGGHWNSKPRHTFSATF